ncbi:MAG: hypothetical protein ACRCXZ_05210 [Patescibacteria group bacterium]
MLGGSVYHPYALAYLQVNHVGSFPNSFPNNFDQTKYLVQTKNNCGPYVVNTLLQLRSNKFQNPHMVINNINFRFPNEFTLPIGIKIFLEQHGFRTKELNLLDVSSNKKIEILKYQLSKGRKIIAVIRPIERYPLKLHYILLLGYDEDNFYIYDPGLRRRDDQGYSFDHNGPKQGNSIIKKEQLIKKMSNGHIAGIAKDYALVVW